jgi:MoaA/NifB/PqqE/SkfB family radical SAM enzyme
LDIEVGKNKGVWGRQGVTIDEETRGVEDSCDAAIQFRKLWLYTNFDCNLRCTYCVTESTPEAPRRPLGLANARRLVDEAAALGFGDVFFTGGEPFILDEIYEMLAYASTWMRTTVLTNGMLMRGRRLDRLSEIADGNLWVQVSLDGGRATHHDPYRGEGTWVKTVEGIKQLISRGIQVCISTTETPANSNYLDELHTFRRGLGIADEDHFVRPMARRGFATEGVDVGRSTLEPELTVTAEGIYWHPLISPNATDMRVMDEILSLADAVACISEELEAGGGAEQGERIEFT